MTTTTTTPVENKLIEIIEDGVRMLTSSEEETFVNYLSRVVEENEQPVEAKRFKSEDLTVENPTPRFQLFSAKFHVDNVRDYQTFLLSGYIKVFTPTATVLFNRKLHEPIPILNTTFIDNLTHTQCSIPIYTFPNIIFDLYAIDYNDHNLSFHVTTTDLDLKDIKLPVQEYDTFCKHKIKARGGSLDLVYIILTDPVYASIEIHFKTHPGHGLCGDLFAVRIIAYYDSGYGLDTSIIGRGYFYPITLLEDDIFPYSDKNPNITLDTSFLAVPAKGTLVIRVMILNKQDLNKYVDNDFKFSAKRKGSSNACITNEYCSFEVKVSWKYEAPSATQDENTLKPEDELIQQTEIVDPHQADHGPLQRHQGNI